MSGGHGQRRSRRIPLLLLATSAPLARGLAASPPSPTSKSSQPTPTSFVSAPDPDHDVIIVGGSLVGLATAASLTSRGVTSVRVFERARRQEPIGALLSLFPNGLTALENLASRDDGTTNTRSSDIAEQVAEVAIPLTCSHIKRGADGETVRRVESNAGSGESGTFLCWYQLQQFLASAVPNFRDRVALGMEFASYAVDDESGLVKASFRDRWSGGGFTETCRVLIGADGVHSSVRRCMQGGDSVVYNSYDRIIFRALVDASDIGDQGIIPQQGEAIIYKGELGHIFKIWSLTLPKDNAVEAETGCGTLALTATVIDDGISDLEVRGWTAEYAKERFAETFSDFCPEVKSLIDLTPASAIYANAVCDMDCLEVWNDGPVIVIGDAAHAMTPSLGQGANIGLEDACQLGGLVAPALLNTDNRSQSREILQQAMKEFQNVRLDRVREIHSKSRMQALNKNKEETTLGSLRERDPAFFERLYKWRPQCKTTANSLLGRTICFTGRLKSFTRAKASEASILAGAEVAKSVTKKVEIVVCGERTGTKRRIGLERGCEIWNEEQFLAALGQQKEGNERKK